MSSLEAPTSLSHLPSTSGSRISVISHDFPSFDEAAIYIKNSKQACWSFRTWQMLVKLPTQTCKRQQVCWLNSHSLDCFRVWICLYFHPPELSLWSQWCSYVIGVSSSISHTYIEAGTPSNDLGMHLYYIFLYNFIHISILIGWTSTCCQWNHTKSHVSWLTPWFSCKNPPINLAAQTAQIT